MSKAPQQPQQPPELQLRANAAVQTLLQEVATLHARLADQAGEIAVARATIAQLQAPKPRAKRAGRKPKDTPPLA